MLNMSRSYTVRESIILLKSLGKAIPRDGISREERIGQIHDESGLLSHAYPSGLSFFGYDSEKQPQDTLLLFS